MTNKLTTFASTPGIPLLVEGQRDEIFFSHMVDKLEYNHQVSEFGGLTEVMRGIEALVRISISKFGVVIDLDEKDPSQVHEQIYSKLDNNFQDVSRNDDCAIVVGDRSKICVGYTGLPDSEKINQVGISKHAIEDHILQILLTSDESVRRISSSDIENSDDLCTAVIDSCDSIESHIGAFPDGKVPLEIAKILLGYEGTTDSFINSLLKCSTIEYSAHRSTSRLQDVLNQLEQI